jgi:phosphoglycerate dehydrogenase-like enzyme
LGRTAEAIYLADLAPADRADTLRRAAAVLSHDTSKELQADEIQLIRNARLLQFTAAGVDWVPTRDLPRELPVAANKGGGAEPMSEHIVALALAAAKRLFIEHANQPAQRQPHAARRHLWDSRLWQCWGRDGPADARLRDEDPRN